jgi:hypothetical protein
MSQTMPLGAAEKGCLLNSGAVGACGELTTNEDACREADLATKGRVVKLITKGGG